MAKLIDSKFKVKYIKEFVDDTITKWYKVEEFKDELKANGFDVNNKFLYNLYDMLIYEFLSNVKAFFEDNNFKKRVLIFAGAYDLLGSQAASVANKAIEVLSDDVINDWYNNLDKGGLIKYISFKNREDYRQAFYSYMVAFFKAIIPVILKKTIA